MLFQSKFSRRVQLLLGHLFTLCREQYFTRNLIPRWFSPSHSSLIQFSKIIKGFHPKSHFSSINVTITLLVTQPSRYKYSGSTRNLNPYAFTLKSIFGDFTPFNAVSCCWNFCRVSVFCRRFLGTGATTFRGNQHFCLSRAAELELVLILCCNFRSFSTCQESKSLP